MSQITTHILDTAEGQVIGEFREVPGDPAHGAEQQRIVGGDHEDRGDDAGRVPQGAALPFH